MVVSGLSSVSARIKSSCNLTVKCFEMPNVLYTRTLAVSLNDTAQTKNNKRKMGLKISTIAGLPENEERSYYLYILYYYNWDEPISNTL